MSRLLNFSFSYLQREHFDVLDRAGILRNIPASQRDRQTRLPIMKEDAEPEHVLQCVQDAITEADPQADDVVVVSGVPDVVIYVVDLLWAMDPPPMVLVPLGRKRSRKGWTLQAFREVLPTEPTGKGVHIMAGENDGMADE